jgi:DNA-directed RNA polymerase subunit K/omega
MSDIPAGIDSTFRYILIAGKRAEQLMTGARSRVSSRFVKPTTIALAELAAEKVPWRAVSAEEFEQLRQQELAARDEERTHPAIPTPLPLPPAPVEPEAEGEEEELEDELEGALLEGDIEVPDEVPPEVLLNGIIEV